MNMTDMQPFEQSFTVLPPGPTDHVNPMAYYPQHQQPQEDNSKYLLETFHQFPHGDFRPTFYNPFEIKHRRRTSRAQLKVLEKSFAENPKPNATVRRILAQKLDMTPRGVQIWFQNRRAKAKLQRRKASAEQEQQQTQEQEEQQQQQQQQHQHQHQHQHQQQEMYEHQSVKAEYPTRRESMDQSVLFSQFFAHMPTADEKPPFTSYLPPSTPTHKDQQQQNCNNSNGNNQWSSSPWQDNQHIACDSVRSVATAAAAAAVASTSATYDPQQWYCDYRRHSAPSTAPQLLLENFELPEEQQRRYSEPHSSSLYLCDPASTNMAYLNNNNNGASVAAAAASAAAAATFTPIPTSEQLYTFNDMQLTYPMMPNTSTTTPPLTSSCSASTVSNSVTGSPISLDGFYDPLEHSGDKAAALLASAFASP